METPIRFGQKRDLLFKIERVVRETGEEILANVAQEFLILLITKVMNLQQLIILLAKDCKLPLIGIYPS